MTYATTEGYAGKEVAERLRHKFKPKSLHAGAIKEAVWKACRALNDGLKHVGMSCTPERVRNLMRGRARPHSEETDLVRAMTPDFIFTNPFEAKKNEIRQEAIARDLDELAARIAALRASLNR